MAFGLTKLWMPIDNLIDPKTCGFGETSIYLLIHSKLLIGIKWEIRSMTDIITPKVENLKDLITYKDGSVVSREIIRKSTGTVTLFTFDKGQGLSEHTAPFDALVQILDGEAEITISAKPYHLVEGQINNPASK